LRTNGLHGLIRLYDPANLLSSVQDQGYRDLSATEIWTKR